MKFEWVTEHCTTCGAVVYYELTVDGQPCMPCGEPDKHMKWHEENGH